MESIRSTTERLIKNWQESIQKKEGDILNENLKKILTKQEKRHIKYCSWSNSRVILGVDSSAWLYMLHLKKRPLLKRLNQVLPPAQEAVDITLQLDTSRVPGDRAKI